MDKSFNYLSKNKNAWNKRTQYHIDSEFYNMPGFLDGATSLNPIELNLLGDISGKSILHLQCHFGQDTLSLARMGAIVTGVDLSDTAIQKAEEYNARLNLNASFICCDIYELPKQLNEQFDIIYTSYGTIGWLPDMTAWAAVISRFLKPGGKLVFVEFHPVVWMFDEQFDKIAYNYFNAEAIQEISTGTYTDKNAPIEYETVSWNHSLSEVIQALIKSGLDISHFQEYDYSPYNCFSHTVKTGEGQYRIEHLGNKIPMLYSLVAMKGE